MAGQPQLLIQTIKDVVVVNFNESSILDTFQIETIGKELYDLVDTRNHKKLILDFSKVKFLSSSALGMLINLKKKSDGIKGRLIICAMRDDLMKVFKISKLDRLFEFCPDEKASLEAYGITIAG